VYPACCPTGPPVYALGTYHGRLRVAILAYKERGRRDLATPLGAPLAAALLQIRTRDADCGLGTVWMVPVPSRNAVAGRRGGQHVALLARRAAAALAGAGVAAAVAPALRMGAGVRDSVGLSAMARRANLAGRVLARRAGLPPAGTTVVLVDDVVTTGATASACAAALVQTGVAVSAILALAAACGHSPS
jgi:predicted amidophosphoribosyltransferase